MALDLTQLKEDFHTPKTEVTEQTKMRYGKVRKKMEGVFSQIGVYINEEGFEKTKSGAFRFFEFGENGSIINALEKGEDVKSEAFLDKLAKGSVFAFPAGQEKPVQISLDDYGEIRFSKPLDNIVVAKQPTAPVKPQEPVKPKLTGWARFANAITFGRAYKKEVQAYNEYPGKLEQYNQDLKQYQRDEQQYQQDYTQFEKDMAKQAIMQIGLKKSQLERSKDDISAEIAVERRKEEALFDAVKNKNYVSKLDAKLESMSNYYRPKPVQNMEITGSKNGQAYTQEQFDQLKPIDISGIKIGGKQLTDDQFAALAMCAALMPIIAGEEKANEYGKIRPLTSEDQVIVSNTFFTCDLGKDNIGDPKNNQFRPREKAGAFFGPIINTGREYALHALQEYQKGRPVLLGKLIAYGAKFEMQNQKHQTLDQTAQLMNDVMIGRVADVAFADRELTAAAEKGGMTPQMLWGLKGTQKLVDVYRENERAETLLQLDSNKQFAKGLSDEERAECIKSRLHYETVNESIRQHKEKIEKSEEYKKAHDAAIKNVEEKTKAQPILNQEEGETVEEFVRRSQERSEKLAREALIAQNRLDLVETKNFGMPDIFMYASAKDGIEQLTNALIPNQDKLMKLEGKELENALKDPMLASKSLADAKKETQKAEPVVQKQVVKAKDTGDIQV